MCQHSRVRQSQPAVGSKSRLLSKQLDWQGLHHHLFSLQNGCSDQPCTAGVRCVDVPNPCRPGISVRSLRGLICGPYFVLFPWLMWSHQRPPPHTQSRRPCHLYLADEKQAQRGEAAYLKSHSCDKAVLESSTEGNADGDGAQGARVEADGADSVGDPGADPDVMIFMVGLGSNAG